ncbi:hypothetical protein OH799_05635 [Nocardia sp. NBC_00881]|nr:hypothetical protein OH799_05635 [Nocardia sp. NBC_00881]
MATVFTYVAPLTRVTGFAAPAVSVLLLAYGQAASPETLPRTG